MKYYYYSIKNKKFGPFTLDELKDKKLMKSTLVWTEGMKDWEPASSVEELNEITIPEPPALPKKETPKPVAFDFDNYLAKRYDMSYRMKIEVFFVGFLLIIIPAILSFSGILQADNLGIYAVISLIIRLISAPWADGIANELGEKNKGWGLFAFFLPAIALMIIGLKRKDKFQIVVDNTLTKIEQYKKLLSQAEKHLKNGMKKEAEMICNYIEENYEMSDNELFRIASMYFNLKKYEPAEKYYLKLNNNEQFSGISNYYLGLIKIKQSELNKAKLYLNEAVKNGEIKSLYLLNTISQNSIYSGTLSEIKKKFNLEDSLFQAKKINIVSGNEYFGLSDSKDIQIDMSLFWNGLLIKPFQDIIFTNSSANCFFIVLGLIKNIERTENVTFKIELEDNNKIVLKADQTITNTSIESIEKLKSAYEAAYEEFFDW